MPDTTTSEQDQRAWDRWRRKQYETSPYPASVVDGIINEAKAVGISGVNVHDHDRSVDQLRQLLDNLEDERKKRRSRRRR